jgi:protein-disulfide isomerase
MKHLPIATMLVLLLLVSMMYFGESVILSTLTEQNERSLVDDKNEDDNQIESDLPSQFFTIESVEQATQNREVAFSVPMRVSNNEVEQIETDDAIAAANNLDDEVTVFYRFSCVFCQQHIEQLTMPLTASAQEIGVRIVYRFLPESDPVLLAKAKLGTCLPPSVVNANRVLAMMTDESDSAVAALDALTVDLAPQELNEVLECVAGEEATMQLNDNLAELRQNDIGGVPAIKINEDWFTGLVPLENVLTLLRKKL